MIKLKDLLYEMNLLIPRKVEGRIQKYIQSKIKEYIKNNNVGEFDISGLGLTKLPASLKDLKIGGYFNCDRNELKLLTNVPTSVKSFYCRDNYITSLAGGPTSVVGDFECNNNLLDTLTGGPVSVDGSFDCSNNSLTSLAGAPTRVGIDFNCYNNKVKFTEKQVRSVCDVTWGIYV